MHQETEPSPESFQ